MTALECPHCRSVIIFPTGMAGKTGHCPNCSQPIDIPSKPATEEELREYLRRLAEAGPHGLPRPCDDTDPDLPTWSRSDTNPS